MSWLFTRALAPHVLLAGAASLVLNLMLLVPAIFTLQVFERVFTSRSVETLAMLGALVLIALALAHGMDLLRARSLEAAGDALARILSKPALQRMLQRRAQAQATDGDSDSLGDVGSLRAFLTGGAVALLDAPWLVIHLGVITLMHPALGAAATAGALALLALGAMTERLTRALSSSVQQRALATRREAQALLRRAETVAGMGMGHAALERWTLLNDALLDEQALLARRAQRLAAASRTLQQGLQATLLALGAWLVIAHDAAPGIMVAASLLLGRALQPAAQLIAGHAKLVEARSAWRRLQGADTPDEGASRPLELTAPRGAVSVERLVYGGSAQRAPLLKAITLEIEAGQSLGLVGASGSGKSTLARLLLGLWTPRSGVVRIDGADISQWDRERLAPHVGYLPQEVEVFAATVAENIARLGEPDSTAVIAAAQLAQAHEMILRLPQGYDTPVGEGGVALSAGQRQRIALARALYGNPRLVVLDDPGAHLDNEGERALAGALRELKARGCTAVVITQRSPILAGLDRIALLEGGQLRAVGTLEGVPPARALRAVAPPAVGADNQRSIA